MSARAYGKQGGIAPRNEASGAERLQARRIRIYSQSHWSLAWRSLRHNPLAMFGLVVLVLLAAVTLLAPWLAPYDPTKMDYDSLVVVPGGAHLFGTDDLGRDILSRVIWGGRESLRVAVVAILVSLAGGLGLGLVAGYYGGIVESAIMRVMDVFLAFPSILLMLSIVAALGPSLTTVLIALAISAIPGYSRIVRASVLSAKNLEYVTAARVIGATDRRIMVRHILPNIAAPLIVYSTVMLGGMIYVTAGLSYIGLGAQPPSPEWGAMLSYGRVYVREAWWLSVFPGMAIFIAVLSVNLLGDGLREALDPKLRHR
ncbi:MAG: ABC transporter permease [Chloroflexi bacterium]|nr:ABC transporter permease [Chloroflexota bacterium]